VTILHVATTGSDRADGSVGAPLRTINRAAALAMPGDTVRVNQGIYREWVRPQRGGISDARRITYEAPGERVVIKGSEVVTGWVHDDGDVWRAEVDNEVFGDFNPFAHYWLNCWLIGSTTGGHQRTATADFCGPVCVFPGQSSSHRRGHWFEPSIAHQPRPP
jgi:hypothetical protein